MRQVDSGTLAIRIVADPETDLCRYNTPTVDEIAVLIVGDNQDPNCRDPLLYKGSEDDEGLELEVTGWVLNKR